MQKNWRRRRSRRRECFISVSAAGDAAVEKVGQTKIFKKGTDKEEEEQEEEAEEKKLKKRYLRIEEARTRTLKKAEEAASYDLTPKQQWLASLCRFIQV